MTSVRMTIERLLLEDRWHGDEQRSARLADVSKCACQDQTRMKARYARGKSEEHISAFNGINFVLEQEHKPVQSRLLGADSLLALGPFAVQYRKKYLPHEETLGMNSLNCCSKLRDLADEHLVAVLEYGSANSCVSVGLRGQNASHKS